MSYIAMYRGLFSREQYFAIALVLFKIGSVNTASLFFNMKSTQKMDQQLQIRL